MAKKKITKKKFAIRYASRERATVNCRNVQLWDVIPTKRSKPYNEYVYWLGSVSNLLFTYEKEEFGELFGQDNIPDAGQCLELKITR